MTQEPAQTQERPSTGFVPDELAVDIEHLKLVTDQLEELNVEWSEVDQSEALGLALLTLPGLDKWAASIPESDIEKAKGYLKSVAPDASLATFESLDKLLTVLRARLAGDNGGWTPTMGKHRFVQAVGGLGEINGGGKRYPKSLPTGTFKLEDSDYSRSRVRVGLLDTAIVRLPVLAGRYIASTTSTIDPDDHPRSVYWGHATFIAGLILQEAPNTELDVRAVLQCDGGDARAWEVAKAMVAFAGSGVKVLNLSFGCLTRDDQPPLVLERAVDKLDPEIVLVAAAGNHGKTALKGRPVWPAALDSVVAVGAQDKGKPASFSPPRAWIDLAAPGVDVEGPYFDDEVPLAYRDASGALVNDGTRKFHGTAIWSGTSFSAATITGQIAAGMDSGKSARDIVREMKAQRPGP